MFKIKYLFLLFFHTTFFTSSAIAQSHQVRNLLGTNFTITIASDHNYEEIFEGFYTADWKRTIQLTTIPGPFIETTLDSVLNNLKQSRPIGLVSAEIVRTKLGEGIWLALITSDSIGEVYSQSLLFGDSLKTYSLSAISPIDDTVALEQIRSTLTSIDKDDKIDAVGMQNAPFTIDVAGTSFEYKKYLSGLLVFAEPVIDPEVKPMFTIVAIKRTFSKKERKSIANDRFKDVATKSQLEKSKRKNVKINGLRGFEFIAVNKEINEDLIYHVVLFQPKKSRYFIFSGLVEANADHYIGQFKKILKTLQAKK